MKWYEEEDIRYSNLYENGYPPGDPYRLVDKIGCTKDKKVLDLGCGPAILARKFDDYTGVDISSYVIERNRIKYPDKTFYHRSLHNLGIIKDKHFDVIILADVLEHIPPNKIRSVLFEIQKLDFDKIAMSISTRKSVILDAKGKNLHLTVWSKDKWIEELDNFFKIIRTIEIGSVLIVELERLDEKQISLWKKVHQTFELNYHKQGNYRRHDDLWNEVWNTIYVDFCEFHKEQFSPTDILLDIGCGSRPSLEWFANGTKYYTDPLLDDFKKIPQMKSYWNNKNTIPQPAEELINSLVNKCDFVQCWNVLDHTYNWEKIIENMIRYLKKGGILLLGTDIGKTSSIGHPGIDKPEKLHSIINHHFLIEKQAKRSFKFSRDYCIKGIKK